MLSWAILCASADPGHGTTSIEKSLPDEIEKLLQADIAETSDDEDDDGNILASRAGKRKQDSANLSKLTRPQTVSAKGQQGMAMMWDELAKSEKDEEAELKKIFYSFGPLMAKAHNRDALTATSRGWFKKMRRSVKKRWRRARRSVRKRWRRTRRSVKKRWNRVRRGVKKVGRKISRGIRKIGRKLRGYIRGIRNFFRNIRRAFRRLRSGMAKVRYYWRLFRSVRGFVRIYPAAPNRMLLTQFSPDEGLIKTESLLDEELL